MRNQSNQLYCKYLKIGNHAPELAFTRGVSELVLGLLRYGLGSNLMQISYGSFFWCQLKLVCPISEVQLYTKCKCIKFNFQPFS